ncbi:hypothetical protein ACLOJK_026962 [Asimina triloba]
MICDAALDEADWPLIAPLPSYGRGRDEPGGRYSSLIMGSNLTDVVITGTFQTCSFSWLDDSLLHAEASNMPGDNGTINGQGAIWWDKFKTKQLNYTRGYLIELMFSDRILISHITLVDSPSWNVHPVYSSNVIVKDITILAPLESPNTDGINPDSCSNVRIEDSFVVSGDDCIAIKSGWDQYGIAFGMPTEHVIIRRFTCISPTSAVIALGSEMSGGIQDVRAEEIYALNSESGVRIKTAPGRGGFVKDVYVKGMSIMTMKWVFWMTGNYGQHPDNNTDLNAMPVVKSISYSDVVADNVTMAAELDGIPNAPFTDICLSNVTVGIIQSKKPIWNCTHVQGVSSDVSPRPCDLLPDQGSMANSCPYPTNKLPIEDVEFKMCYYKSIHQ